MKRKILLIILSVINLKAIAQLKMPALFGDSMVLQQNANASIWGWASPGQKVEVSGSWSLKKVETVTDKTGKWMVILSTPKAGGPYNIDIRANETKRISGVLIGEVWICSGQSNMEMPVEGWANDPIKNSSEEIASANYPSIRLFTVQKDVAFNPREDVTGSWSVCASASVRSFSATAYFFAKELYARLKVPIGLVHTSWGGTIAEAWTSEAALRTMGDFDKELNTIDSVSKNLKAITLKDSISNLSWQKALSEVRNPQINSLSNEGWKVMQLPTVWENAGHPDLDAIVWFKRIVKIPESWVGKDLKIDLGPIDDRDITYFNGEFLDSTMNGFSWAAERHYTVPGKLVKAGENTISVCVIDDGGTGGLYGVKENMKIYPATDAASTGIGLDGEWHYKIVAAKPKQVLNTWPNQPSVLYNAMIAPLIPYSIRGAIWYQGESNVGRAKQYTKLFPLMISDWRKRWNEGAFPFYFVQIAPFTYMGDHTQAAALRDAQRRTLTLSPNTGMAITLDIGNLNNIHPANKQDVGKRLALWALNKTYNHKDVVYSGPLYKAVDTKVNKVIVSFTNTEGGLSAHNGSLKGFELKDTNGLWKPAAATIDGDKVIVVNDSIQKPKAVRYAFYDSSVGSLFNGRGLPASSFTSEDLN